MDADAQIEERQAQPFALGPDFCGGLKHLQGCETGVQHVQAVQLRHTGDGDIGVADRLQLLDLVARHGFVESGEVAVEHPDQHRRLGALGEAGESLDVGKQDRGGWVEARLDLAICLEFVGDADRQDTVQQFFSLRLLPGECGMRLVELAHRLVELDHAAAMLEQADELLGEPPQRLLLLDREVLRLEVHDADGADRVAFRRDQRHRAVEAKVRIVDHEGEVAIALVDRKVGRQHDLRSAHRDRAEGDLAGAALEVVRQTVLGLEPEPILLDERHVGNRALADLRRQLADLRKSDFRRRIHDFVRTQGLVAFGLVVRNRIGLLCRHVALPGCGSGDPASRSVIAVVPRSNTR